MIKIISKDNNEKGLIFERFIIKMLDGLGYHNFRTIRKTGRQIDILAKNRVTDQPIICECKAYKDKLDGDHLSKFRGVYDHEYDKNKSLIGLFFSLSGFNDGFLEYYEEIDDNFKKRFKIYSPNDIFSFINKAKIIESKEVILEIIKRKLPYDILDQFLAVTEHGEFWIITFGIDGKQTHFTILSAKGDEVQNYIITHLCKIDPYLKKIIPINLNINSKTVLCLTDNKVKSIEDISTEIYESTTDINLAISNLLVDEKIINIDNKYKISDELEVFINLSKEFLTSKNKIDYFRSNYVQSNINNRFINYIQTRFYVHFNDSQKDALINLFKVSPAALLQSFTAPTGIYKKGYEQIKERKLPQQTKKMWMENSISAISMMFSEFLIADLKSKEINKILEDNAISGYSINIETVFATEEKLYFKLNVGNVIITARAAERMEAGQLISTTDLSFHLRTAMIYANLQKFDLAFKEFDKIINSSKDEKLLCAAWNNKGLVFTMLKKFDEAIKCYEKSIEIDDQIKEPFYNIGRALISINKKEESVSYFEKALKLDPNYSDAKQFLK